MMNIGLRKGNNWTLLGVQTILDQLGIQFTLVNEVENFDVLISDHEEEIESKQYLIVSEEKLSEPLKKGGSLEYRGFSAYFPQRFSLESLNGNSRVLAFIDGKWPGIVQRSNKIYIIPNFFKYISQVSTLRMFDKTFAENFSWDSFRNIFLTLLEYVAKCLDKTLIRKWYYPSFRYSNSITFTTDIDHKLSWEILKNLNKKHKFTVKLQNIVPRKVQWALALLVAKRFYSEQRYRKMIKSRYLPFEKIMKNINITLPVSYYFASLSNIYHENIPITAFLRSREFQQEERKDTDFPSGTGKEGYSPHSLNHVDIGLHFGATIGKTTTGDFVNNPYRVNPFGKAIISQVNLLSSEVNQEINGARLHHIFGFNQDMFKFLNNSGIKYDSSMFGSIKMVDTKYSPNGCTMPYYPIIYSQNGNLIKTNFVEIPACAYEIEEVPFESLINLNSAIVVSEHPDKIKSKMTRNVIRYFRKNRNEWWKVNLSDLAEWWRKRALIKFSTENGMIKIDLKPRDNFPMRVCIIVYPSSKKIEFSRNTKILGKMFCRPYFFFDIEYPTS